MKLMPHSLYGRLLAILLVGLMVPQLLSALVHLYDRDTLLHQTMGADSAEKISSIVELLDGVDPAMRSSMVEAISGYPLEVVLNDAKESTKHPVMERDAENEQLVLLFQEYLQRRLPGGYEAHVEVVESQRSSEWMQRMQLLPGMQRMHEQMQQRMGPPLRVKSFHVQVRLKGGVWVDFHYFLPKKIFAWPTRMVIALSLLMVAVLLLTWVAVRWVTRPLSTLSAAAEALGKDIRHPPLSLEGPTEVRRAAEAFNTMQQRLSRYIGDRARILSAVSHDLKTPITRLRLRTELLEDQQLRSELESDLNHMEEMVHATLDFMRGTEKPELRQKIDLEALLESLQEDLYPLGIQFQLHGTLSTPVDAQLLSLKRCLTNLLENAARYGEGNIAVTLDKDEQSIRITIHNEGEPIAEEELKKVFDPFYRVEHSRNRESGGTGLGLSIARNIVHAHGGELLLENAPQGGVSAIVELPR
ncbi:MAG: HAMP domain-containing protein [Candidatus Marinimicrobia bacterium]|jgi:signal transduction histidine kinase|nr:HAMP domain-containing protein [Candidatus Neomarinimicrobiota bacterium]MBT5636653.1 HAMP domain-containing protein [Gammaproteobacteria bacterium]MBT6079130.1 HAMP domain-containing protein [Gammaproteobacteria bacterium]MBT7828649.1 HAMP domain-containing protein [Candidatus Neomarinimicrobiota bacterium]